MFYGDVSQCTNTLETQLQTANIFFIYTFPVKISELIIKEGRIDKERYADRDFQEKAKSN